jgi:hypothetical protein
MGCFWKARIRGEVLTNEMKKRKKPALAALAADVLRMRRDAGSDFGAIWGWGSEIPKIMV